MNDVITKFSYLQYGKIAPRNSSYKGVVTTESIIGFRSYTEREESRELHKDAAALNAKHDYHGFFNYTTKRLGSTMTYSSQGWIDNEDKEKRFRDIIKQHFCQDGDIIWTPVISLKDYMSATEVHLFNEKDYAAVMDKVLPKFFRSAGLEPSNMEWWMDHHVNTDNPHIHLSFFEKNKTKENGKLSMKQIDTFKKSFWNEVFSKKRFLEKTGNEAEQAFKEKDILKKSVIKEFHEKLDICTDKQFLSMLKKFATTLPTNGRLQYGSSHMIPYREELDALVDYLLHTPALADRYQEFCQSIRSFDSIATENIYLKNKDSFFKTEDTKLRKILANDILKEIKNNGLEFVNKADMEATRFESLEKEKYVILPVATSLLRRYKEDSYLLRLPGTKTKISINKENVYTTLGTEKQCMIAVLKDSNISILYSKDDSPITKLDSNELTNYFNETKEMVHDLEKLKQDFFHQKQIQYFKNLNWKPSSKKLQQASFSWMNEIENEVEQARIEFLSGKELIL